MFITKFSLFGGPRFLERTLGSLRLCCLSTSGLSPGTSSNFQKHIGLGVGLRHLRVDSIAMLNPFHPLERETEASHWASAAKRTRLFNGGDGGVSFFGWAVAEV